MLTKVAFDVFTRRLWKTIQDYHLFTPTVVVKKKTINSSSLSETEGYSHYFTKKMNKFDAIVLGGGISGLSATLTLARCVLKVLCIDSSEYCNRFAEHSQNFLTHDGESPLSIISNGRKDISKYDTAEIKNGKVKNVTKNVDGTYKILTEANEEYSTSKVIFATGVKDKITECGMENIEKFWGNYVIPCPYCHGYEVKGSKTGFILSEHPSFPYYDFVKILNNWANDLTVITNPKNKTRDFLSPEMVNTLKQKNVKVIDKQVVSFEGENGKLKSVTFEDGSSEDFGVIYYHPQLEVNCASILENLGVEFNPTDKLIKVNQLYQTSVSGIYACGDNITLARTLAGGASQGVMAASMVSKSIFLEKWNS